MGCAFFGPQSLLNISTPSVVFTVCIFWSPLSGERGVFVDVEFNWANDGQPLMSAKPAATDITPFALGLGSLSRSGLPFGGFRLARDRALPCAQRPHPPSGGRQNLRPYGSRRGSAALRLLVVRLGLRPR